MTSGEFHGIGLSRRLEFAPSIGAVSGLYLLLSPMDIFLCSSCSSLPGYQGNTYLFLPSQFFLHLCLNFYVILVHRLPNAMLFLRKQLVAFSI